MTLQGTLDTFALPDVLRLLAATKKTGRLRITGGRGTGSVWVVAGEVSALEATHAPHATELVDALFELLRFEDGVFAFDAEATHEDPSPATDVELLLQQSGALLAEWRGIEAVVSSMDAWVTLRKTLTPSEVTIDQDRWRAIVAVGTGATVRRIGDELCLAELPISRAIKELAEAGLVEIDNTAPAGAVSLSDGGIPTAVRPLVAPKEPSAALVEPETFVPLDLPGRGVGASYAPAEEPAADPTPEGDDLAAAFPGLANRLTPAPGTEDDAEIAKQLATLSPRAASAIRAAADATSDEEREAALDAAEGDDQPLNRGLLLKFLSSVKS